jgi:hypothetical protein
MAEGRNQFPSVGCRTIGALAGSRALGALNRTIGALAGSRALGALNRSNS